MKNYEHVLETVELALVKGEYHFCIEFLYPIIESYPLSSKEGAQLRTILITALCGINKKEEAKKFCKELLKSYDYKTRENGKYLMDIIDSPEIKKPDNWNIKFESNSISNNSVLNSLKPKNNNKEEKKFINITNSPTGETKPLQRGFALVISLILLLLIPLLSGCVKVENTIDLSDLDSISNILKVESKYIKKLPWQIKFEEKIKDILPDAEISLNETMFSVKNTNLNLDKTKLILNKIQQTAADLAGVSSNLNIVASEKNFIFLKKYNYMINFDLQTFSDIEDLELYIKIINPNKATYTSNNNRNLEVSKEFMVWDLIPGEINSLEFAFWRWNKLLLAITFILIILVMAYLLRFYRYQVSTDFPQLPS